MHGNELISIGRLSERTGAPVSAIRYYEAEGLLNSERSRGGQRRFLRADIRRLSFVLIAQQLGFPLARIRKLLAGLPDGRAPTKQDWTRISHLIREDLDSRIVKLTRLRANLDGCIGCGCLSLKACALYNPEDRARRLGTGARYVEDDRERS